MTKTPYELRMELLELAYGILSNQAESYSLTQSRYCEALASMPEREDISTIIKRYNEFFDSWDIKKHAVTTEEIVKEAEKLNVFIGGANVHDHS